MHAWKAEFLFVRAPNEAVARRCCYFSRASTNTGRTTSYLELKDDSAEELVEYFKISEYPSPNNSSFKGPSNWIPFKEMFYDDIFLVAALLMLWGLYFNNVMFLFFIPVSKNFHLGTLLY